MCLLSLPVTRSSRPASQSDAMRSLLRRRKPIPERHPLPGWPAAAAYPDSLNDDLIRHLFEQMFAVQPGMRLRSRWVMTPEWHSECRKLTDLNGRPLQIPPMSISAPELLLGIPVEIRAGSGPPHLEPVSA